MSPWATMINSTKMQKVIWNGTTQFHYNTMHTLQWRHNGHDGISNHQPHDYLCNCLFRCRSQKTSKLRVTGLCAGNSPETGEFPTQMASNVENVSIWWRHHVHRNPHSLPVRERYSNFWWVCGVIYPISVQLMCSMQHHIITDCNIENHCYKESWDWTASKFNCKHLSSW